MSASGGASSCRGVQPTVGCGAGRLGKSPVQARAGTPAAAGIGGGVGRPGAVLRHQHRFVADGRPGQRPHAVWPLRQFGGSAKGYGKNTTSGPPGGRPLGERSWTGNPRATFPRCRGMTCTVWSSSSELALPPSDAGEGTRAAVRGAGERSARTTGACSSEASTCTSAAFRCYAAPLTRPRALRRGPPGSGRSPVGSRR